MSTTTQTVDPVNGANYFGVNSVSKKSDLDMASFLNLLVVQLQNQNPLEPMSDSEFYAQLAQMGTVQGVEKMTEISSSSQAANLLGKVVTATRPTSSATSSDLTVTGVVKKTYVKDGVNYIGVEDTDGGIVQCKLSDVKSVEPSLDISNYSNLIGKTVSGATNTGTTDSPVYAAVSGVVQSIYISNSKPMATIKATTGSTYEIGIDTIASINT
jgi:flagellar basal-body rod modification protein FlgD